MIIFAEIKAKKQEMNITKLNNPSINFFKSYENEILKTRDTLFHELDKTSTKFGDEARKILKTIYLIWRIY